MRRLVLSLVLVGVLLLVGYAILTRGPGIPDAGVLVVELGGGLEEAPPVDALSQLVGGELALPTLLLQLEKAAADDRIRAVLVHIRPLELGYARVQELRDALAALGDDGRKVAALVDVSSLNATREIYLASAADEVYVAPGFVAPLGGIAGEYLFLGGLTEKLGVRVEYERVGAYKSAPETFAEKGMSPAMRTMTEELLDTLYRQIVAGIAQRRDMSLEDVMARIDEAPAVPADYVRAGLVDGVATRAEIVERLGGPEAEEVELDTYAHVDPRTLGLRRGPAIALVFGTGTIVQSGDSGSFLGERFMTDRTIAALREAEEAPDVRAIVLRINSGGGSPLASDDLWREIRRIREAKPVVASLADAAASGGYYVACAADAVVAEPATLTGSIGVFLLRPSLAGLYDRLDVHAETLSRGRSAGLASTARPLTPEQRRIARALVDTLYTRFLERVAEGRGMSTDEVDALGQGRVWLGETARTLGLVDEVGGLATAVERAKREAGIAPEEDPRRVVYPGPRGITEQIRDLLPFALRRATHEMLGDLPLPEVLRAWTVVRPGEPAYLPTGWLEIR